MADDQRAGQLGPQDMAEIIALRRELALARAAREDSLIATREFLLSIHRGEFRSSSSVASREHLVGKLKREFRYQLGYGFFHVVLVLDLDRLPRCLGGGKSRGKPGEGLPGKIVP